MKPQANTVENLAVTKYVPGFTIKGQRYLLVLGILSLLFSGLSQAIISPPLNWVWLHLVSWLPAFWVFTHLEGHRAFYAGWLVGISANLAIFYWIPVTAHNYLSIPVPLTPLLLILFAAGVGLYVAVFSWGFQRIRRYSGTYWPFAIAAWFCALEFLMPQLFTYYQGVAWYQQPAIFLLSSVTGVTGVTFLVILGNALLLQLIESIRQQSQTIALVRNIVLFTVLLFMAIGYSLQRMDYIEQLESNTDEINIALIQPNYNAEQKRLLQRQVTGSFAQDLINLSTQVSKASDKHVDVYVWPENALPFSPGKSAHEAVRNFARQQRAEIWTGATFQESNGVDVEEHRNSAFRVDTNGLVDTRYDKSLLIPFGEYVPFRDILPGMGLINPPGNFIAGDGPRMYQSRLANFSFLICYEVIKSGYVRQAIQTGAELLVNISGDVRSGNNSEQSQYLMLATVQSAQYGVPQVRSTSTGISAIIDARGMITDRTNVFEKGGLVGSIKPLRVESVYAKYGDWFAMLCILISLILFMIRGWLRS